MPLPNQIEKEISHLFFNLLELDLEDEEESIFMSVVSDIDSKVGVEAIALLSCEDLRSIGTNLPFCLAVEFKSLQLHLHHLQEEVLFSIDDSCDYSSIDESVCRNLMNHPTVIS